MLDSYSILEQKYLTAYRNNKKNKNKNTENVCTIISIMMHLENRNRNTSILQHNTLMIFNSIDINNDEPLAVPVCCSVTLMSYWSNEVPLHTDLITKCIFSYMEIRWEKEKDKKENMKHEILCLKSQVFQRKQEITTQKHRKRTC